MKNALRTSALLALSALSLAGCATLQGLSGIVQAPRLRSADDRNAELRLSRGGGRGYGATLRVFAHVDNPNPFGITLSTVRGSLFLEGQEAADVDLPLGLELGARDETVVPIDITIPLEGLPGLASTLARAVSGAPLGYRIDGTLGVRAGELATPTFGPLTLLEGEVRVR